MKAENYWFALKSHVYVEFKKRKVLLYDTRLGNHIETSLEEAIELITLLYKPENLGVIPIKNEESENRELWNFIREILEKKMGDLMEIKSYQRKPVRLIPILNLQKDIDKYTDNEYKETFIGKDISKYLLEINFYLNDSCDHGCKHCNSYYKQLPCCISGGNYNEMPIDNIESLLKQLRYSSINAINLLGGNILKYNHLSRLQELFTYFPQRIHCYIYYKNFQKHELLDSQKLELIINFPIDEKCFQSVWKSINDEKTKVHFIIENEQQYNKVECIISTYGVKQHQIYPFYTMKNIAFFEDNIYVNKEDIFHKTFQMREIFRNKKLNSNFFGTLHILPDGTIKANMNTPTLGNIATDDLLDVVYKELIDNTAWRTVRNSQPCSDCVYQYFCPAPSDYEREIGRNNLCHIKIP